MSSHPKGVEPALCPTCRDIVGVAVDYSVDREVARKPCPDCGSPVERWGDPDRTQDRPCPRCGGELRTEGVTMVD